MSLESESGNDRRQRLLLLQALESIRRREVRALGPLPRRGRRYPVAPADQLPTPVKTRSTIIAEADAADRALTEMFADGKMRGPRYRKLDSAMGCKTISTRR
jgi:hypothetical protein